MRLIQAPRLYRLVGARFDQLSDPLRDIKAKLNIDRLFGIPTGVERDYKLIEGEHDLLVFRQ